MTKAQKKKNTSIEGTKLEPKAKLEPVDRPLYKLGLNGFQQAEFARQFLRILPDHTHTVADTLRPEYWAHVAEKLQITDRIEALWKDNTRFAEYIVIDKGPQWVKVVLIADVDFTKVKESKAPEQKTNFKVEYGNHEVKYVVVRLSDNTRISDGHKDREAAEAWLADHRKSY
jgi:hypothetical protein